MSDLRLGSRVRCRARGGSPEMVITAKLPQPNPQLDNPLFFYSCAWWDADKKTFVYHNFFENALEPLED